MAKTKTTDPNELKILMWKRLSSLPEILDLDMRSDEEPEDLFVRLCNTGHKKDIVNALKANLCSIIIDLKEKEKQAALRFMQRAIRLCDIIGAYECKPVLKLIILDESRTGWGKDFEELQELAARALDGMPKEESDFEYWSHLAEKHNTILPYALNAMIEIDLDRGIQKLIQTYFNLPEKTREDVVNWEMILKIALDAQGPDNLGDAIDKVFTGNPLAFEFFVHHVARMPALSREGKRSIEDMASYSTGPFVTEEVKIDNNLNFPLSDYQLPKTKTAIYAELLGGEFLTTLYGTLSQPQNLLSNLTEDYRWKYYSPVKTKIP